MFTMFLSNYKCMWMVSEDMKEKFGTMFKQT